ncbi:MAG: diaminopimelate epimerase [Acidiferrobacteraceae bacterium]
MKVRFTKMHGLGNDFVVLDSVRQPLALSPRQVRFIADRHRGIGCDQVLVVEPATRPEADFRYRIFNADGTEVEQCGNGARCFAHFVYDEGLTSKRELTVETLGGVIRPRIEQDGRVTVNMGIPNFDPRAVPFDAACQEPVYTLDVDGESVEVSVLSIGNPHAVQFITDVDGAPVASQGRVISGHPRFPSGVNAGYAEVRTRHKLRLRVYERGVGETLACGTGACAAVAAGRARDVLGERVEVELRGGLLEVQWSGSGHPILMTGPATRVYDGIIDWNAE